MSDQQTRSILLFFYLAFLNAEQAIEATYETCRLLQGQWGLKRNPGQAELIRAMLSTFQHFENRVTDYTSTERDLRFAMPKGFEPKKWLEFLKETPNQEVQALLWIQVLKFDLPEVARALGVSEGTMRHRVGRALRSLGEMSL